MPQIPVYQPGQATAVGAPVPVNSPTNTGGTVEAEAVEGFGRAIQQLAFELIRSNKESQKERDQYMAKKAETEYEKQLEGFRMREEMDKIRPDEAADGGVKTRERFYKFAEEAAAKIKKDLGLSERAAMYFDGNKGDKESKKSLEVLITHKKKIENEIKLFKEQDLNSRNDRVRMSSNPQRDLLLEAGDYALRVEQSELIAPVDKQTEILAGHKQLVAAFFDGFETRNDYDGAIAAIKNKNGEGYKFIKSVLGQEEMDKQLEELTAKKTAFVNFEYSVLTKENARLQREKEAKRDAAYGKYVSNLAKVENDQVGFNATIAQAAQDPDLEADDIVKLQKTTAFMNAADDEYESRFWYKVNQGTSFRSLQQQLSKDKAARRVSDAREIELRKKIDALTDEMDSQYGGLITAASAEIKNRGMRQSFGVYGAGADIVDDRALQANSQFMTEITQLKLRNALTVDNINDAKERALSKLPGGASAVRPDVPGYSVNQLNTLEAVDQAIKDEQKKYEIDGGKYGPALLKQHVEKMRRLKETRDFLRRQQIQKPGVRLKDVDPRNNRGRVNEE